MIPEDCRFEIFDRAMKEIFAKEEDDFMAELLPYYDRILEGWKSTPKLPETRFFDRLMEAVTWERDHKVFVEREERYLELEDFRNRYERHLGPLSPEYQVFTSTGRIDLLRTLEYAAQMKKKLAFKYYCALGLSERLPALWNQLSEEDQKELRGDYRHPNIFTWYPGVVQSASIDCVRKRWNGALWRLYGDQGEHFRPMIMLTVWMAILQAKDEEEERYVCTIFRKMRDDIGQSVIDEVRDDPEFFNCISLCVNYEETEEFLASVLALWQSRTIPEDCRFEIFDRALKDVSEGNYGDD